VISPPLKLHLDGAALVSNWRWLAAQSGAAACGAAVKADAYGLGAREVVRRLAAAGCQDFFVAHWGEAAAIADLVPPAQISVLNGLGSNDALAFMGIGAVPVLNTPQQIARWKSAGGGRCHIMLDSGINRLGLGPEHLGAGILDNLHIDILLSHLASADEDVPQNDAQLQQFHRMAQGIGARRRSLANSSAIMLGRDYHFDLTRPGLSLYGGIARHEHRIGIKPVVRLQAIVLQIRDHAQGAPIGYNATHTCTGPTRVATLAIGYADGYGRGFSGKGTARFDGAELPVLGRVSMDLLTIDTTAAPHLKESDWVNIDYDLSSAAQSCSRSQYELLTGLGHRSDRLWT
jgi:alanine racemase